jgi:cyclophilin family peptidyl-prolyl cis-trans isomerase
MHQTEPRPEAANRGRSDWRQRAVLSVGVLAVVIASGLWIYKAALVRDEVLEDDPTALKNPDTRAGPRKITPKMDQGPHGIAAPRFTANMPTENFLDSFGKDDAADDGDKTPASPNDMLQKHWTALERSPERLLELEERLNAARAAKDAATLKEVETRALELSKDTDRDVAALQKELARARQARPKDPLPQWLTGELLIFIRAEPELILPYFEGAGQHGLDSARLWASRTRVQLAANRIDAAYQSALKALERDSKDRYTWEAFTPAAFAIGNFAEVAKRLVGAYAGHPPTWAQPMLNKAVELAAHWNIEQDLRKAEEKADDLPRVRLVIEHRRFAKLTSKLESTGTEEVVVELFENEAPATVANFLTLVSKRFYDGTTFFLSNPAQLVAGGCPLTKNADPADDGSGGPGYTIPDEFASPKARRHFRGSLAMVNSGQAHSAGSRFYITLLPQPMMDGKFTVFGRVIKGQEAVERITQGRTHPNVAPFGRIIPGDVLVRVEVIRQRAHEYRVIKTGDR